MTRRVNATSGLQKSLDEFNAIPPAPYGILKISERRFMVVCQSGRSQHGNDQYCTPTFTAHDGRMLPFNAARAEATARNNIWWEQNQGKAK